MRETNNNRKLKKKFCRLARDWHVRAFYKVTDNRVRYGVLHSTAKLR